MRSSIAGILGAPTAPGAPLGTGVAAEHATIGGAADPGAAVGEVLVRALARHGERAIGKRQTRRFGGKKPLAANLGGTEARGHAWSHADGVPWIAAMRTA